MITYEFCHINILSNSKHSSGHFIRITFNLQFYLRKMNTLLDSIFISPKACTFYSSTLSEHQKSFHFLPVSSAHFFLLENELCRYKINFLIQTQLNKTQLSLSLNNSGNYQTSFSGWRYFLIQNLFCIVIIFK